MNTAKRPMIIKDQFKFKRKVIKLVERKPKVILKAATKDFSPAPVPLDSVGIISNIMILMVIQAPQYPISESPANSSQSKC